VDIDRGALVIQAERHERAEDKGRKYVMRESSSSFYRRIILPELADEAATEAKFDKGVLRVTVPFAVSPSPKKIAINAAGDSEPVPDATGDGEPAAGAS
jgi:HSP20 family protein